MESTIYICEYTQGSYEERDEIPCCAFTEEKDAEAYVQRFNDNLRALGLHDDQGPCRGGRNITFEGKDYYINGDGARAYHFTLILNPPIG